MKIFGETYNLYYRSLFFLTRIRSAGTRRQINSTSASERFCLTDSRVNFSDHDYEKLDNFEYTKFTKGEILRIENSKNMYAATFYYFEQVAKIM